MIQATGVRKTYGTGPLAVPVLHGVDLEVRGGELVLLSGPSGSGKTTLVSILGGLLRPTAGEVHVCGARVTELEEAALSQVRRSHVGFVFQSYNLFAALTALDNVAEVARLKGRRDARACARAALERVGLEGRMGHRPGELSGGQKQRVAIARAMATDPELIIGDEITSALDGPTAMGIMELLRGWVTPRRAILLVTHDQRMERFADRIIEMEDGRIGRTREGGWRS